jgi:hypothetical protein
MMTADDRDGGASQAPDRHGGRLCPKCAAWQRLVHSFLDATRGKTVRVLSAIGVASTSGTSKGA